jgi:hypothetical protein
VASKVSAARFPRIMEAISTGNVTDPAEELIGAHDQTGSMKMSGAAERYRATFTHHFTGINVHDSLRRLNGHGANHRAAHRHNDHRPNHRDARRNGPGHRATRVHRDDAPPIRGAPNNGARHSTCRHTSQDW